MARRYSLTLRNVNPLSQNNRYNGRMQPYRNQLGNAFLIRTGSNLPLNANDILGTRDILHCKVFYLHKVYDSKDADNISKPLWDAFNARIYLDDNQIIHRQALKINTTEQDYSNFEITNIEIDDLEPLLDFLFNPENTDDRLLYIDISDYESKNVIF